MKGNNVQQSFLSNKDALRAYAEVFAFLGNSLLSPVSQTPTVGLDSSFWEEFPTFDSAKVQEEVVGLIDWSKALTQSHSQSNSEHSLEFNSGQNFNSNYEHDLEGNFEQNFDSSYESVSQSNAGNTLDPVTALSVEYTRLFIGPPSPAAAPWETFYRNEEVTSGFGHATIEMRDALRSAGLQVSNKNNQYEDHIGIELLYVSHLCSSTQQFESNVQNVQSLADEAPSLHEGLSGKDIDFIKVHPLSWIEKLQEKVRLSASQSYYDHLLGLSKALLESLLEAVTAK